jgi:hypothetical protein
LLGPREFVDRRQNSIVPPSNEFLPQVIENAERSYAAIATIPLQKVDFRCFRRARPAQASRCQRMALRWQARNRLDEAAGATPFCEDLLLPAREKKWPRRAAFERCCNEAG